MNIETTKCILQEEWKNYLEPLSSMNSDLEAGIALLTELAIKKFPSQNISQYEKLENRNIHVLNNTPQQFVQKTAIAFRNTCNTGFPFSLLKGPHVEQALEKALQSDESIVSCFMYLEKNGITNNSNAYKQGLARMSTHELVHACFDLYTAYTEKSDYHAGLYLLWIIQQAAGCNYSIPDLSTFKASTVTNVLSNYIFYQNEPTNPIKFIEILYYRPSIAKDFLYMQCLSFSSRNLFFEYAIKNLQMISLNIWPQKTQLLFRLLQAHIPPTRTYIANTLAQSSDPETAKIGVHIQLALTASSLRKALPHMYALHELCIYTPSCHFEEIFEKPFIEFTKGTDIYQDLTYCKRLNFSEKKVFIHNSLMIGIYDSKITPPYLLAYDTTNEKIVWGVPLQSKISPENTNKKYVLKQVNDCISLRFFGEQEVYLIDMHTGNIQSTVMLQKAPTESCHHVHISEKKFAYQLINVERKYLIIGGNIVDNQLAPSFKKEVPNLFFRPLGTHCGFLNTFENTLTVFSPTGDQVCIQKCKAVHVHEDKLYSIEEDPSSKTSYLLNIRTLCVDKRVISPIQKSISFQAAVASFENVCDNGYVILLAESERTQRKPIFIDVDNDTTIYSPHTMYAFATHIVNTRSAELWVWDEISKDVWKISSNRVTHMGKINSNRGTKLLHVDSSDHLYFVDIAF